MALESKLFFSESAAHWEEVWPGIRRKIIGYDNRLMMVMVAFAEGTKAPPHHHPHSQTSWIASGKFEVRIGKDVQLLGAGDGFYVPPDMTHSVTALEPGTVIDAFSPHREDFLA